MIKKIFWISRHDLSPGQIQAIHDLHGDVEIVKDSVVFETTEGLTDYIRQHSDGFVYSVAGAPHYIAAVLAGESFGVFENHPGRRQNGAFGLAAVYHVVDRLLKKVWINPDPESDEGESLVPIPY